MPDPFTVMWILLGICVALFLAFTSPTELELPDDDRHQDNSPNRRKHTTPSGSPRYRSTRGSLEHPPTQIDFSTHTIAKSPPPPTDQTPH